jgi:2-dehydro-3-deoxy-D-arabinonate dehydratase
MRIYLTNGYPQLVAELRGRYYRLPSLEIPDLLEATDLARQLHHFINNSGDQAHPSAVDEENIVAPITDQEVWAAGVTYLRSKVARMEESKDAGGGSFYDRVYEADRPEIFFKGTPHRVSGPGQHVRLRGDSKWNVPEPELALLVNPRARIVGYTVGNDMSSRDIEGENPLYLPQAKVYDGSCALGPCVLIEDPAEPLSHETPIELEIRRGADVAFAGKTSLSQMKRKFEELVSWLFRDNSFPSGVYLLTGTGVVPPDGFTLQSGDEVRITIPPIGTLRNVVA